jgi:hypothetical protein
MPVRAAGARPSEAAAARQLRRLSLTLSIVAHGKTILMSGEIPMSGKIPLAIFETGATFALAMDSFSFV